MQQPIILIILLWKSVCFKRNGILLPKRIIVSTHPPLEETIIKAQNTEIIASPYKKTNPKDDESRNANLKDIKSLQQQNNFTNHILGTISSPMDRLERTIALPQTKKIGSISYSDYDSPLFKPRELTKPLKFGNQNKNSELIKILTKKIRDCSSYNDRTFFFKTTT